MSETGDLATSPPSPVGGVAPAVLARGPAEHVARRGSDFAELCRLIKREGLLDRRPRYYTVKFAVMGVLFAAGWAAFFLIGDSWWQLALAVYVSLMFAQVGFLGHEAGHRQIYRSRRANAIVGLVVGDLLIGLSWGWWVGKHSRHHSHPNQEGKDPDLKIAVIAFTPEQARARRGLLRLMARYQAYFFFPLLLLEAVSIHVISVIVVLKGPAQRRWLEGSLLLAHFAMYLTAVLFVLSPLRAIAFIVVQQGLLGLYLGCAFAPNHKGMLVLAEHEKVDFFRRQVLTSRNVSGGFLVETLLGGLNYQIEHHLFPAMPRPSLRRCRTLVRTFCTQTGVLYCEKGLFGSYGDVLRTLHAAGR
jgi:fatty acid desaturase